MIELRAEGLEYPGAFKSGQRGRHCAKSRFCIVKNPLAPHRTKGTRVSTLCNLGDQRRRICIIHFHRIEKRLCGLLFQRIGASIPKMTAYRQALAIQIDGTTAAKPRRRRQIHNGGRITRAKLVGATAQRHANHRAVIAGEGAPWIMAGGARHARRF